MPDAHSVPVLDVWLAGAGARLLPPAAVFRAALAPIEVRRLRRPGTLRYPLPFRNCAPEPQLPLRLQGDRLEDLKTVCPEDSRVP